MDIPDPARVGSACCLVLRVAGTVLGMAASAAAAQDNIAGSAGTQTVCATISADEIRLSPGNFSVLPIGQKVGVTDARVSISVTTISTCAWGRMLWLTHREERHNKYRLRARFTACASPQCCIIRRWKQLRPGAASEPAPADPVPIWPLPARCRDQARHRQPRPAPRQGKTEQASGSSARVRADGGVCASRYE